MENREESTTNSLWAFFSSVRLTLVLLILLAAASILGTLIPQGEGARGLAERLSPGMFRVFATLDLFDMYHSFWFRLLIGGLAFNLIVCSIDRFPGTWKRFRSSARPDRERPFQGLPPQQTFWIGQDLENAGRRVSELVRHRYKRTKEKPGSDRHFFYGEKGRYAHFGVYLVHLSVLIILIGAMVGSLFGFEAFVNVLEGEESDSVTLRRSMRPLKLGFRVRCDRFTVRFYEDGSPKEYRSDLTFLADGKEMQSRSLRVNHPVQFRGVTFYQASYGTVPGNRVRLGISRVLSKPETQVAEMDPNRPLELPGGEGVIRLADIRGDFMGMGPAVLLEVLPARGDKKRFWVLQHREMIEKRFPGMLARFPKLNPASFKPYLFSLLQVEKKYYTGLQANRDPGVPIVWTGCFLMVAGFFVAFFTSHRRIWIRLSVERQGVRISVAGTANKNPVGLERELHHVTATLKHLLEKG